jgi:hypothetical protein
MQDHTGLDGDLNANSIIVQVLHEVRRWCNSQLSNTTRLMRLMRLTTNPTVVWVCPLIETL